MMVLLGALIATLTTVLSTVNVVLGPAAAAVLPARSDAVPAAMLMPIVPEPVMLEIVTVDRKSTRLNSSHIQKSRMPSSA